MEKKMKRLNRSIALVLAATLSFGAIALEEDGDKKKTKRELRAEKDLAKIMKEYRYTGKERICVNLRYLRNSKPLDDQTIFFESLGKKAYMNNLDQRCPRLGYEQRFAYRVSTGQLCSHDIITVLDSFGREWAGCGLGKFKEMERIPKDEQKDESEDKSEDTSKDSSGSDSDDDS